MSSRSRPRNDSRGWPTAPACTALHLRPRDPRRAAGPHTVTLIPFRAPSDLDRRTAGLERQIERAEALRRNGQAEALRQALTLYTDAAREWHALDEPAREAGALLAVGLTHRTLSENTEALAAYETALVRARAAAIAGSRPSPCRTSPSSIAAGASWSRRAPTTRGAMAVALMSNDRRAQAEASAGLARLAFEHGDTAAALTLYEDAARVARAIGDPRVEGYALNGVGNVYYTWGDFDRAVDSWRAALALREAAGDPLGPGKLAREHRAGISRFRAAGGCTAESQARAHAGARARQSTERGTDAEHDRARTRADGRPRGGGGKLRTSTGACRSRGRSAAAGRGVGVARGPRRDGRRYRR